MKRYFTTSDGGSFLFGNSDFSFKLPNEYGDGRNVVYVFDNESDFYDYIKTTYKESYHGYVFRSLITVKGAFNLYNYDCSDMNKKDIKVKLDGKYNIYLRSKNYGKQPTLAIVKIG